MSNVAKKLDQSLESYSPKKPKIVDIFNMENKVTFDEKVNILPKLSGEPPRSGKIKGIHRLYYEDKGENFMFVGCVRAVLESLGEMDYDYNLVMALTGDMFTQMYHGSREADCLTDNCFIPEIAKHVFDVCGYKSVFFTKDEINKNADLVMLLIKDSIMRKSPVIAIGVSNIPVTSNDGDKIWNGTEPVIDKKVNVPFGSIIGGYKDDDLYINVWIGEAITEENGYALTKNALKDTQGVIIIGDKTDTTSKKSVYKNIIKAIPSYLTLKPMNGYVFGKQAFYKWADNIKSKEIMKQDDKWNMHFAPAVILYTNAGRVRDFIKKAIDCCPEIDLLHKLLPLYEKQGELNNELDKLQGGFDFDAELFNDNEFVKAHTDILYELGNLQDEIVHVILEVK